MEHGIYDANHRSVYDMDAFVEWLFDAHQIPVHWKYNFILSGYILIRNSLCLPLNKRSQAQIPFSLLTPTPKYHPDFLKYKASNHESK